MATESPSARRITTIAILLVAAVLLLGGLYLARVTDRLADLRTRNFRIAATLAEVTENKLNNIGDVLESRSAVEGDAERYRRPRCVDHLGVHENDAAAAGGEGGASAGDGEEGTSDGSTPATSRADGGPEGSGHAHGAGGSTGSGEGATEAEEEQSGGGGHGKHSHAPRRSAQIQVDHGAGKLVFYFFPDPEKPGRPLHAEADAGCFFAALEQPEVFDDLVILDSEGKSVFQAGGTAARIHELSVEEAAQAESSPPDAGTWGRVGAVSITSFSELELAGERYAFFRQPVRLGFVRGEGGPGGPPALWEVVGLVRSDRLVSDAMRLDPSTLVILVAVLILALCGWPFVKLFATGGRERIAPREVLFLDLALAVVSALLAIAVLDVGFQEVREGELRRSLANGADEIEVSLQEEIRAALGQLHALKDAYRYRWLLTDPEGPCSGKGLVRGGLDPVWDGSGYPHLEMIFWTDACGNQVAKWAVGEPTPAISVNGRDYFQRVRELRQGRGRGLWSSAALVGEAERPVPGDRFIAQPIRSWTTGTQEVVLSVPYGEPLAAGCQPEGGELGPPIAAMSVIDPPSMLRPVLPPGRGFAVLDRKGEVVLHSEAERNGLESFLEESEGAPELHGALLARSARDFIASYRGREHQMHSRPLAGLPWHLVVFEERSLHQTVNLEAVMAALLLVLLELVLLGAVMGVIRLGGGVGSLRSVWPAPDDVTTYARMMAISLLIALGFVATLLVFSSTASLVVSGLSLPLVAVGLLVAAATPPGEGWRGRRHSALGVAAVGGFLLLVRSIAELVAWEAPGRAGLVLLVHAVTLTVSFILTRTPVRLPAVTRRWLTPLGLFVVAAGLTLSVVGALPAAGFLRAAYQERLALEVRRGQLHLGHELLERRRWIEEEYGHLEVPRPADGARELADLVLTDARDVRYDGYFETCHAYAVDGELLDTSDDATCESRLPDDGLAREPQRLAAWTLFELPAFNRHSAEARLWLGNGAGSEGAGEDTDPEEPSSLRFGSTSRVPGNGAHHLTMDDALGRWSVRIASTVPEISLAGLGWSAFGALLITALASLGLVVAALVFLGRRLFHVDFRLRRPSSLARLEKRRFARLLAVVPPYTPTAGAFRDAVLRVDLEEVGTAGGDRELERLAEPPDAGLVVIDHLEGVLDDAPSRQKGLPIFEYLLTRTGGGLRIAVLAHRDPRAVLEVEEARLRAGTPPAEAADPDQMGTETREALETLERWRDLLERFSERWVPDSGRRQQLRDGIVQRREGRGSSLQRLLAGEAGSGRRALAALWQECRWSRPLQAVGLDLLEHPDLVSFDEAEVVDRVAEDAGDYYRAVWAALGTDERHVLAQLASGCLVNRGLKGPLERLLAWGLVVRDPSTFRVMNESFRRFVLGHHDAEALRAWEAEGSVSFWRQVRVPFFTVLAIAGLFLLVTQRDLFNLAVALASAGVAALPGLVKLFAWFRGRAAVSDAAEA